LTINPAFNIESAANVEECFELLRAYTSTTDDRADHIFDRLLTGIRLMHLEAIELAEQEFRRILASEALPVENPKSLTAWEKAYIGLGQLLDEHGRQDEGAQVWAEFGALLARRNCPELIANFLIHASHRVAEHDLVAARSILLPMLERTHKLALEQLNSLGAAFISCEDFHSAAVCFESALPAAESSDSWTMSLLLNLVTTSNALQDHRKALHYSSALFALELFDAFPNRNKFLLLRAVSLVEMGHHEEALQIIATTRYATVLDALALLRAELLIDLKRYEEASAILVSPELVGDPAVRRLKNRIDQEGAAPLTVDCPHRVLGMILGVGASVAPHQNPPPKTLLIRDNPDLSRTDRARFAKLLEKTQAPGRQVKYGPSSNGKPPAMITTMTVEYVDDVAEFEAKWHLYLDELQTRQALSYLVEHWNYLHRIVEDGRRGVLDVDEFETALLALVSVAGKVADSGDVQQFSPLIWYISDMLEVSVSHHDLAAFIWTMRGSVLHAATRITNSSAVIVDVELRRSLEQYSLSLDALPLDARCRVLGRTLIHWNSVAQERANIFDSSKIFELIAECLDLADDEVWLEFAVMNSLVGNHVRSGELFEASLAEIQRQNPGVRITLSDEMDVAHGCAHFLTRCRTEAKCHVTYGPFAPYIHREVVNFRNVPFDMHGLSHPLPSTDQIVGALGFSDPGHGLIVLGVGAGHGNWAAMMMHEQTHIMRRNGQMLRTDDNCWLQVRHDVPIASAQAYRRLMEDVAQRNNVIAELVHIGQNWARVEPERCHEQIQNMLDYFTALGTLETASSYPCAAIFLGMANALLADAPAGAVDSYLQHAELMSHQEALAYARRNATLQV
jgi:hypothetical protein